MAGFEMNMKFEPPDSPSSQQGLTPDNLSSSPDSAKQILYSTYSKNFYNDVYMDEDDVIDDKDGIRKLCLVCGDVASGLHYGVASCEACKAFFKRTIQGGIEYNCPATSSCEITRSRRKSCQACRFKKCLQMGMLREGVRPDRVRGGRQKYRRSTDSPTAIVRPNKNHSSSLNAIFKKQNNTNIKTKVEAPRVLKPFTIKLLPMLRRIEPEKVYALPDNHTTNNAHKFRVTIAQLTDRELVATICWVKRLPGYCRIVIPDQSALLRYSWMDIVALNIAYRSLPYFGDVVYADDFKVSEEDASDVYVLPTHLNRATRQLVTKLSELRVTLDEYLILKALVLFNPDAILENVRVVQQHREHILSVLIEHLTTCNRSFVVVQQANVPHRLSHLLLILPLLAQCQIANTEFWRSMLDDPTIKLSKLLKEMLESTFI